MSAKDIWVHELKVPYGSADNPEWHAGNVLVNHGVWLRKLDAKLDAQNAAIGELVKALAQRDEAVDVDALIQRIEAAIERVTVRPDVGPTTL